MDVSVLSSTSWAVGLGNVGDVDVDQSRCARGVARLRTDGGYISEFFVLERGKVSEMYCIDWK
jgi:hypothetical protein